MTTRGKDVSAAFFHDAELYGTPTVDVFKSLNRFVKLSSGKNVSDGETSSNFRSPQRVKYNGNCTPSYRPFLGDRVKSSVPIRNWLAAASASMRPSSR